MNQSQPDKQQMSLSANVSTRAADWKAKCRVSYYRQSYLAVSCRISSRRNAPGQQ